MSKGNLFLGFARGKVGDVVFTHTNGEQVSRARNRSPHNPQSPLMMLQRVVMKSAAVAFSAMQDICNHSFQGYDGVTANQAQFVKLNVAMLRRKLADVINSGSDEEILSCSESNFSTKHSNLPPINPYIVSDGRIDSLRQVWDAPGSGAGAAVLALDYRPTTETVSYQQFVDLLGVQRGDQITVLALSCDDTEAGATGEFNGFTYCRFICEPNDGDMSASVTDASKFNAKNENVSVVSVESGERMYILPNGVTLANSSVNSVCAMAYIVSRQIGGVWSRSKARLVVRPWTTGQTWHLTWDHGVNLLSDAIESYMSGAASTLYLNQAEV